MIAYHGKQEIKDMFLARVAAHRAADELIRGATEGRTRGGQFRGCAVVCTMERYDHGAYETEIGVPRILARLEDGLFERLPIERAMAWPEQFLQAIPVGADLSLVWPRFAVWLLADPADGVIRFARTDSQRQAIQAVANAYGRVVAGETVEVEVWRDLRHAYADDAAYAAACAAAYAADAAYAAAYADDAAYDAAADAAAAAAYAAAAYAAAYAAADARSQARVKQADKLLQFMAGAPVPELVAA